MVREVLDDAERERLVDNIVGHLLDRVTEPVLQRAFEYWRNVDGDLGDRVEKGVRDGQSGSGSSCTRAARPRSTRLRWCGTGRRPGGIPVTQLDLWSPDAQLCSAADEAAAAGRH